MNSTRHGFVILHVDLNFYVNTYICIYIYIMVLPSKSGTFKRSVRFSVVLLGIEFNMQLNCHDTLKDLSSEIIAVSDEFCFHMWDSSWNRYSNNVTYISHPFSGIRRLSHGWSEIYNDKTSSDIYPHCCYTLIQCDLVTLYSDTDLDVQLPR